MFNYSAFAFELSWVIQHIIMMYLTFIHTIHRILQEIEQTHLQSPASRMCVCVCCVSVRVVIERRNCIESRRISRRWWRFSVSKWECEYVRIEWFTGPSRLFQEITVNYLGNNRYRSTNKLQIIRMIFFANTSG